jgi:hypothetical protein
MIHFISSCDFHHCVGPSTPSLAQASSPYDLSLQSLRLALHTCNRSIKPSLILIFATLVNNSMSCLICNELLHDTITYGLIPYVSHINTISPPKVITQLPKPNKDLSDGQGHAIRATARHESLHLQHLQHWSLCCLHERLHFLIARPQHPPMIDIDASCSCVCFLVINWFQCNVESNVCAHCNRTDQIIRT